MEARKKAFETINIFKGFWVSPNENYACTEMAILSINTIQEFLKLQIGFRDLLASEYFDKVEIELYNILEIEKIKISCKDKT